LGYAGIFGLLVLKPFTWGAEEALGADEIGK
jgi:hypothetical protein